MTFEPTHAGGLVYREGDGGPEFLLVTASRDRGQWVIPKGRIEAGETPAAAALREVAEEAGVRGRIVGEIGEDAFEGPRGEVRAVFFLMRAEGEFAAQEERGRCWVRGEEALVRLAPFAGARGIVVQGLAMIGTGRAGRGE